MISQLSLAAFLLIVAWLTAGSMAVRSASRIWLRHWAERQLHGASSVLTYLDRPHRLLLAANAGVAFTLVAAGAVLGWRTAEEQDVAVLSLGGYAAAIIVAGRLIPRAIARRWPSIVIPIALPALRAAEALIGRMPFMGEAAPAAPQAATPATPGAAMKTLLHEGELEGVGKRDEIAIISGVMHFGEKTVRDVMTPRAEVFAIAQGLGPNAVAARFAEARFTRVPVYRDTLDSIVGMYHAFDVINEGPERLPRLRPVAHVPASTKVSELLFRMLRQRVHLAVVEDADGTTLGIATLENLLEVLVGDIKDEHDEPSRPSPPIRVA